MFFVRARAVVSLFRAFSRQPDTVVIMRAIVANQKVKGPSLWPSSRWEQPSVKGSPAKVENKKLWHSNDKVMFEVF